MPAQPQKTPTVSKPTPVVLDEILIETSDSNTPLYDRFLEPGHWHHDQQKFSGYRLLKQGPNAYGLYQYTWGNSPTAQDSYNVAKKYSGHANANPIFIRSYRVLRSDYLVTGPIAKETSFTGIVAINVTNGGSGYTKDFAIGFTGGAGSALAGIAIVNRGAVVGISLTNVGTGFTSAPTITFANGDGTGAAATAIIQPTTALLVEEEHDKLPEDDPYSTLYDRVTRVYETLPGPWLYDTRDDLLLGPVQRKRRAILASTIPATLPVPTATSKTTYEAREGSSIVAWEIVETYSDGTGSAGNPAFPIIPSRPYDDRIRGSITRTEQVVIKASQVASLTEAGGIVTRKTYEEVDEFHYREIIETWVLANTPTITTQKYDEASDTFDIISRKLKLTTAIVEAITLVNTTDDTITVVESEGYDNIESIEVATTQVEPVARSSGTQIEIKEEMLPYPFPAFMTDFTNWVASNGLLGVANAFVARVPHVTKTFWTFSATRPALSLDGVLSKATIDNIFGTGAGIKDLIVNTGSYDIGAVTITITASSPNATTYLADWVDDAARSIDGEVKMDRNRYRWRTDRVFIVFIKQAAPTYA